MDRDGDGQVVLKDRILVPEDERPRMPKALTVGASDSAAGSGVQADLKIFAAHGVYGTSVVVAVMAQSTKGVFAIAEVPDEVVVAQIDVVMEDIGADAVVTGVLSSRVLAEVVADRLEAWGSPIVVDPVMTTWSGDQMLQPGALRAMRDKLLPVATIVTPTITEVEALTGRMITTPDDLREATRAVAVFGPQWVVVSGGRQQSGAFDLLFDGNSFTELPPADADASRGVEARGTVAAAITANLALGHDPRHAIEAAYAYANGAANAGYAIGGGRSPVNHFYRTPSLGPAASTTGNLAPTPRRP